MKFRKKISLGGNEQFELMDNLGEVNNISNVCMYVWYGMFAFQVLRNHDFAAEWFISTKAKFFRMISKS